MLKTKRHLSGFYILYDGIKIKVKDAKEENEKYNLAGLSWINIIIYLFIIYIYNIFSVMVDEKNENGTKYHLVSLKEANYESEKGK